MGRAPCCDKANVKKGPWSPEEDALLKAFIEKNGTASNWMSLPHKAGLKRCGKSYRLRWLNYLRPNIKHGHFSDHEDGVICTLYSYIGSRWSIIAAQLAGRADNDIKNYWNTKLKKKLMNTTMVHPPPKLQSSTGFQSPFQFGPSIPSSPISSSSPFLNVTNYHNKAMPLAETPFQSPNLVENHQAEMGFVGYNSGNNLTDYGLQEIRELISSNATTSTRGNFFFFFLRKHDREHHLQLIQVKDLLRVSSHLLLGMMVDFSFFPFSSRWHFLVSSFLYITELFTF